MRKALAKVDKFYARIGDSGYTAKQVHQIKHLHVQGSNYGACRALRNRGDKHLAKAFTAIKKHGGGGSGGCGGIFIDFCVFDHREVVHCLVHGNLDLSKHGKAFYHGFHHIHVIVSMNRLAQKMKAEKL